MLFDALLNFFLGVVSCDRVEVWMWKPNLARDFSVMSTYVNLSVLARVKEDN